MFIFITFLQKNVILGPQYLSLLTNSPTFVKHILGWAIYLLYYLLITYIRLPDFDVVDLVLQHLVMVGVFYANIYLVFDNLFTRKRYFAAIGWFIVVIGAYILVRYGVVFYLIPLVSTDKFHYSPKSYTFITIAFFVNFLVYSAVYWFVRNSMRKEYQLRISERHRLEAETARIKSDYAFLKAQVSPHFLHNTLNFLYAKLLPLSRQLSDCVLILSDVMRYALNEDGDAGNKTSLTKELEHIRNVIKINQLRFSDRLYIHLEVIGEVEGARVIPFILITLVENAFKHGEMFDPENPIKIKLEIDWVKKKLYLQTYNKKKGSPIELSTGIGLNNLKKRLEWVYGKDFIFETKDQDEFYTAYLELSID